MRAKHVLVAWPGPRPVVLTDRDIVPVDLGAKVTSAAIRTVKAVREGFEGFCALIARLPERPRQVVEGVLTGSLLTAFVLKVI